MHRMRHYVAVIGLIAGSMAFGPNPASAALIRPDAKRSFPDIAADINGKVEFDYDPASQTGVFTMTNTPFLIAGGDTADSEFPILPDADGVRKQTLRVKLDESGAIVEDPGNMYELRGKIEANGQTFSNLLLKGAPVEFGALDLGGLTSETDDVAALSATDSGTVGLGVDIFDLKIAVEEGELAPFFGDNAYLRITPELESTFEGSFTEDFMAFKATSNIRSYDSPTPFPIPEPSALAVLLAGGLGLVYHRHRRRSA